MERARRTNRATAAQNNSDSSSSSSEESIVSEGMERARRTNRATAAQNNSHSDSSSSRDEMYEGVLRNGLFHSDKIMKMKDIPTVAISEDAKRRIYNAASPQEMSDILRVKLRPLLNDITIVGVDPGERDPLYFQEIGNEKGQGKRKVISSGRCWNYIAPRQQPKQTKLNPTRRARMNERNISKDPISGAVFDAMQALSLNIVSV